MHASYLIHVCCGAGVARLERRLRPLQEDHTARCAAHNELAQRTLALQQQVQGLESEIEQVRCVAHNPNLKQFQIALHALQLPRIVLHAEFQAHAL